METQTGSASESERRIDKSTLIWVALGIIIVGVAGFNLWAVLGKKPVPTSQLAPAPVPDFTLINQLGQPLGLEELIGKIWVADFIFTHCPTICPMMTQEMARLQSEFVDKPIYFVSFSVDAERDSPEVLSRYAAQYGADARRWYFLTGERERIYELAKKGFKLAAGHRGSEILHSTRFVLVGRDGNIYGRYDSRSKPALSRLRRDINLLLGGSFSPTVNQ